MGIVVSSRTKTDLDKLAKEIAETAPKVEVVVQPCDAQSETDAEQLASVTWEKFGRVDAVVANAGVISGYVTREDGKEYLPVGMTEDPDFERVIGTNLLGTWRRVSPSLFTASRF